MIHAPDGHSRDEVPHDDTTTAGRSIRVVLHGGLENRIVATQMGTGHDLSIPALCMRNHTLCCIALRECTCLPSTHNSGERPLGCTQDCTWLRAVLYLVLWRGGRGRKREGKAGTRRPRTSGRKSGRHPGHLFLRRTRHSSALTFFISRGTPPLGRKRRDPRHDPVPSQPTKDKGNAAR
jgi:hypothetical protein